MVSAKGARMLLQEHCHKHGYRSPEPQFSAVSPQGPYVCRLAVPGTDKLAEGHAPSMKDAHEAAAELALHVSKCWGVPAAAARGAPAPAAPAHESQPLLVATANQQQAGFTSKQEALRAVNERIQKATTRLAHLEQEQATIRHELNDLKALVTHLSA